MHCVYSVDKARGRLKIPAFFACLSCFIIRHKKSPGAIAQFEFIPGVRLFLFSVQQTDKFILIFNNRNAQLYSLR
ncbi:hypothetical protein D3C78_909580 [compost metagenome]